jgi:PAS domain-containing protein
VEAARAVLRALLPESASDIRGAALSVEALRQRAGYAERLADFEELLHILDGELRLLTPASAEEAGPPAARRYQLTHDYLVPSLHAWLTQQQRETRRGRAELYLVERAAAWATRHERRQLPTLGEWLSIRFFTRSRDWTASQRDLMRQATRLHGLSALIFSAAALLLAWGSWEGWGRYQERARREALVHPELTPEARAYLRELDISDLVNSMPGVFYLKDRNGVYIFANDNWTYFLEDREARFLRGSEIVGKTDFDLPWKENAEEYRRQDREVLASGEAKTFRAVYRLRDGTRAPFVIVSAPLRNRRGEIIGIIGYAVQEPAGDKK